MRTGSLTEANEAVELSPADPEVYRTRAGNLLARGEFGLAVDDLRRAVALRPGDSALWIQLGKAAEANGDIAGAVAALLEAARLAPANAGTHWDTGMLLLKSGRRDEAFKEFHRATLNQPALFTRVIELAWAEYGSDGPRVAAALNPSNTSQRLELAHFFIGNGKASEVMTLVRGIDSLSDDERSRLVNMLLSNKSFAEAYVLWAAGTGRTGASQARGIVDNPGFENGNLSQGAGFSWTVNASTETMSSVDSSESHTGTHSLRINWKNNPDTSGRIVSQLLLVEPNARYEVSFVARAQNLVTGAAPIITVTDVSGEEQKLGYSLPLPLNTTGWEGRSVEFATTGSTRAVRIALQRQNCSDPMCPIFGTLWLDDFGLRQQTKVQSRESRLERKTT